MAVATSEPPHAHPHQHQSPHQHPHSPHQHQHSPLPHQQHPHALHAQPHPLHAHAHPLHSPGKDHEHDVHGLRLALGSILSPKRYASPSSHASSGSASPAHFGPGLVHPYYPPPSHGHSHLHTPSDGESEPDMTATAAVVVVRDNDDAGARERDRGRGERRDGRGSALHSRAHSVSAPGSPAAAGTAAPPILTTSNYTAPRPTAGGAMQRKHSGSDVGASASASAPGHNSGTGSPGGYIATLQSKRAWDALVHGNMS